MIGHLRGTLLSKKPYQILLDVNGVGYEVRVPYSTSQLPGQGKELSLVIHTHVREDALTLYGFKSAGEREMFLQLLTVKNVGPKMALMVLAAVSPADIKGAIKRNNPLSLVVPGIGPKTAERIVQELRNTFVPVELEPAPPAGPPLSEAAEEAVSALENMGCDPKLAERAVREVLQSSKGEKAFDALMKGALQWLRERKR
ncbi:MAG: Holliday junction branch migration protein RuvA [Candidatus Acidiferrales bacterium]